MNLDDILNATGGGASIISEQHDLNQINWQAGSFDVHELNGRTGIAAGLARANLNKSRGRISMMSARIVPWTGLGVVVSQAANGREVLPLSNLDAWGLGKIRQTYEFNGVRYETDTYSVVRSDTGESVGEVGKGFEIFHNEECVEFVDSFYANGARYETAGALGKGEKIWLLAKMPESADIKGDQVEHYNLLINSHDGSGKINFFDTTHRPVCANTLRIAYDARRGGIAVKHTKNVKARMQEAAKVLQKSKQAFSRFVDEANVLAGFQLEPQEYFNCVLDDILDVTIAEQPLRSGNQGDVLKAIMAIANVEEKASAKKQLDRALRRRTEMLDDILTRYESDRNNGNPAIAGTAWSAVNAVTEHVDYSGFYRFNGTDKQKRESAFESAIYGKGDEMKATAFSMALAATR